MDRVAVFVDAGYLFAGGSAALCDGQAQKRQQITLNVPEISTFLTSKAASLSGLPLLRIYWYDGALVQGLTTDQQLLSMTDNIKLSVPVTMNFLTSLAPILSLTHWHCEATRCSSYSESTCLPYHCRERTVFVGPICGDVPEPELPMYSSGGRLPEALDFGSPEGFRRSHWTSV